MSKATEHRSTWWGNEKLKTGNSSQWNIGPLSFAIEHLMEEWKISYERQEDDPNTLEHWSFFSGAFSPIGYADTARYILRKRATSIEVKPMLADRTVVMRPAAPINLIAGEEVMLFVSSPLWVQICVDGDKPTLLQEIAIHRPSDTWFGPSTRQGELCYASKTSGRLQLDQIPQRPHRAITPLVVRNLASNTLLLERVALPAPLLSLFATDDGQVWTQTATLVRETDGDMASLQIGRGAPKESNGAKLISGPRKESEKGVFIRAFSALFN